MFSNVPSQSGFGTDLYRISLGTPQPRPGGLGSCGQKSGSTRSHAWDCLSSGSSGPSYPQASGSYGQHTVNRASFCNSANSNEIQYDYIREKSRKTGCTELCFANTNSKEKRGLITMKVKTKSPQGSGEEGVHKRRQALPWSGWRRRCWLYHLSSSHIGFMNRLCVTLCN